MNTAIRYFLVLLAICFLRFAGQVTGAWITVLGIAGTICILVYGDVCISQYRKGTYRNGRNSRS